MAEQAEDDGRGCLLVIGLVIAGIAVGHIFSAAVGWLVIGVGLVIAALWR